MNEWMNLFLSDVNHKIHLYVYCVTRTCGHFGLQYCFRLVYIR
jgi:hypothetical protein